LDWKRHLIFTKVGYYNQLSLSRNSKRRENRLSYIHPLNRKSKKKYPLTYTVAIHQKCLSQTLIKTACPEQA